MNELSKIFGQNEGFKSFDELKDHDRARPCKKLVFR